MIIATGVSTLLLCCTGFSVAPQGNAPVLAAPQFEELLDRVSAHTERYKETFKDLTAEERRTFELFAADGTLEKQNRLVADLIVYQSQRQSHRLTEFRHIREVDGQPVKKSGARLEKLFERLTKDDSADKEMGRISKESTRYDFGYQLSGYLFHKAIASWKVLRSSFRYEVAGRERVGERELLVVKFEQTQFRKEMFGMEEIFDRALFIGPLMRGTYWIDADTAQIWREQHEIFFRNNQSGATHKVVAVAFDFVPSKFALFLPQRVVLEHFRLLKAKKGAAPQMYRSARVTSEFGTFQKFNTEGKQDNLPRQ